MTPVILTARTSRAYGHHSVPARHALPTKFSAALPISPAGSFRQLCSHPDHYTTLGVSRKAGAEEIKKAYFQMAKANHPDLNKSPDAARKFRLVAEAYDVLRHPASRRAYDARFSTGSQRGQGFSTSQQGPLRYEQAQKQQGPRYGQQRSGWQGNPNDIFRQVWSELGMAEIDAYIARIQTELHTAIAYAGRGDRSLAWRFAREHRAIIIGTIAPAVLLLRIPMAAMWATRLIGPLIMLARVLPVNIQWYLLSRLWVRAVLYMEQMLSAVIGDHEGRSRSYNGRRSESRSDSSRFDRGGRR